MDKRRENFELIFRLKRWPELSGFHDSVAFYCEEWRAGRVGSVLPQGFLEVRGYDNGVPERVFVGGGHGITKRQAAFQGKCLQVFINANVISEEEAAQFLELEGFELSE